MILLDGGCSTCQIMDDWRKLIFMFSLLIGSYYLGVSVIPTAHIAGEG